MKIHSDYLTESHIQEATRAAGMVGVEAAVKVRGSRSRKAGLVVNLTGNSPHPPAHKDAPSGTKAASWDEWGMFLQCLFEIDPDAVADSYYRNASDFGEKTDWRFESLTASDQHKRHRWEFSGIPREFICTECEAVRRY